MSETKQNGHAIERVEPTTQLGVLTKEALKASGEQRALLLIYVRQHLIDGLDYGRIPGTPKPTLFKPGALKLFSLFRCSPKVTLLESRDDFDKGHGFFSYKFRVSLTQRDSGAVLAVGVGSCNSHESKYRWRETQRKCPNCAKATIIKGKAEFGGGWLCFGKKGGCGAKFPDDAPAITTQVIGRVENPDVADLANTILKMAKKRAEVDAALALDGCSDIFTQDVEDLEAHLPEVEPAPPKPAAQAKTEAIKTKLKAKSTIVDVRPGETEEQALARTPWGRIQTMLSIVGLSPANEYVRKVTGKTSSAQLVEEDVVKIEAFISEREHRPSPGPTPERE